MSQEIGQKFLDELTDEQRQDAEGIRDNLIAAGVLSAFPDGSLRGGFEDIIDVVSDAAEAEGYDEDTAELLGEYIADTF